jgi:hypothetical protein
MVVTDEFGNRLLLSVPVSTLRSPRLRSPSAVPMADLAALTAFATELFALS